MKGATDYTEAQIELQKEYELNLKTAKEDLLEVIVNMNPDVKEQVLEETFTIILRNGRVLEIVEKDPPHET